MYYTICHIARMGNESLKNKTMSKKITIRDYAKKIVEVAYYEVTPNKETVTNVLEALINECIANETKHLQTQLQELTDSSYERVKLLTKQFEDVKRQNLELQEKLIKSNEALFLVSKTVLKLQHQLSEKNNKIDDLTLACNDYCEGIQDLKNQLADSKSEYEKLDSINENYIEQISSLCKQLAENEKEIERYKIALNKIKEYQMNYVQLARTTTLYNIADDALNPTN